ncbi:MAG TPA: hypothetical protein VNQ79_13125 [Blastocatellia bacterium]|nr:hypothetical protein [Blastocatellia bacterium]
MKNARFSHYELFSMTDEQRRSHAMSQLRAARELYSETGNPAYLAVIDAHLRTIAEVDERRRLAEARRAALLELRQREAELEEAELKKDELRMNEMLEEVSHLLDQLRG